MLQKKRNIFLRNASFVQNRRKKMPLQYWRSPPPPDGRLGSIACKRKEAMITVEAFWQLTRVDSPASTAEHTSTSGTAIASLAD